MNKPTSLKTAYSVAVFLFVLLATAAVYAARVNPPAKMPEFTQDDEAAWLNSKPLKSSDPVSYTHLTLPTKA